MKIKNSLFIALAAGCSILPVSNLRAADAAPTNTASALRELHMKVDASGMKKLNDSPVITIPTVYLKLPVAGKVMAVKQTSGFSLIGGGNGNTVRASAHYSVNGLDKKFAQELAKKVYDDLVAKLREAGYTVKTYDDIKDMEGTKKVERLKVDPDWGMPLEKSQAGNDVVVIACPSDDQMIKPGFGGAVFSPFQHFGKSTLGEEAGTLIIPTYIIAAPQAWGETSQGYSSISAEVNVAPGMNLMWANAPFLTAKGAWGGVKMKGMAVNISTKVGDLTKQDATDTAGNAFSSAMNTLTGAGKISTSKGIYVMTIDPAAYEAGLMNGVGTFNTQVANAAKEVKK